MGNQTEIPHLIGWFIRRTSYWLWKISDKLNPILNDEDLIREHLNFLNGVTAYYEERLNDTINQNHKKDRIDDIIKKKKAEKRNKTSSREKKKKIRSRNG